MINTWHLLRIGIYGSLLFAGFNAANVVADPNVSEEWSQRMEIENYWNPLVCPPKPTGGVCKLDLIRSLPSTKQLTATLENLIKDSQSFILLQIASESGYYRAKLLYRVEQSAEWKVFSAAAGERVEVDPSYTIKNQKQVNNIFETSMKSTDGHDYSKINEVFDGPVAYVTLGKDTKRRRYSIYCYDEVDQFQLKPLSYEALSSLVTAITRVH